jgi:hypothetical protein
MDGTHARSWRFYHARPPGVTGDSEGEGRGGHLVICLDGGETYPSPDDWPQLPSAEPGETLAAFWDRAIVGDPFLQSVTAHTSHNLQGLPWVARPAEQTFARWEERWPDKVFYRSYDESAGNYHRDRVCWRLVVELCERLRAGDLVMKGRRTDVSEYPLEVVNQGLFRNPFMMLRPRIRQGGWFRPEQWHGSEPPQSLPSYHELMLWPAKTTETKQKAPPGVPYPKLLRWWTTDYLPRYREPDKRPNVETQRTDAAAAFPDHTPPTVRTMQRLRADKDTPPEWRGVGRRPKSD